MSQPNLNLLYLKKHNNQYICVVSSSLPELQVVKLNYGMKEKNPIDYVNFYKKNDPDNATTIDKSKVGVNVISTKLFIT